MRKYKTNIEIDFLFIFLQIKENYYVIFIIKDIKLLQNLILSANHRWMKNI